MLVISESLSCKSLGLLARYVKSPLTHVLMDNDMKYSGIQALRRNNPPLRSGASAAMKKMHKERKGKTPPCARSGSYFYRPSSVDLISQFSDSLAFKALADWRVFVRGIESHLFQRAQGRPGVFFDSSSSSPSYSNIKLRFSTFFPPTSLLL